MNPKLQQVLEDTIVMFMMRLFMLETRLTLWLS